MSARALQRVVVRMHHDPDFCARVVDGREALNDVPDLDDADRALLRGLDVRAFATDPLRPARTLQALLDEAPVSVAVTGTLGLLSFFAAREFHDAVQTRASLAPAFLDWLAPRAGDVAVLERRLATARRAPEPKGPAGHIVAARGVSTLKVRAGTLDFYTSTRKALGKAPADKLAQGFRAHPPLAALSEHVFVQPGKDGISLSLGTQALAALVVTGHSPAPKKAYLATARMHGAEPGEDHEVLDALLADGLLVVL